MKKRESSREKGIALFMVISAVALLSILVTELTYTTQMNTRLSYNYIDSLRAFYLAKAALRLSMLKLKAYQQVLNFVNDPQNKQMASAVNKKMLEQIWRTPLVYPIPIPPKASPTETDAIKKFMTETSFSGTFNAGTNSESSKLNLNQLFVKAAPVEPEASPAPTTSAPSPTPAPVNFREILEPAIQGILDQHRQSDREFAEQHRNTSGKDVVDAIEAYLFEGMPASNLPGFKMPKAKMAPFYSLSELHLIPGFDDELYNALAPSLTVYATPGINVNTMDKKMLMALFPLLTPDEAETIMKKRDDEDVGKPFEDENEFYTAVSSQSNGAKSVQDVKNYLSKSGIKLIFSEQSFKIGIYAKSGLAEKRVEAYVTLESEPKKADKNQQAAPNPQTPQQTGQNIPDPNTKTSANKSSGVNLIYWRML